MKKGKNKFQFSNFFRVVEFRAQIASMREIISRRHLKVAFFGRTSSGKSTIINALLGTPILPTGLGHTTDNFVHIQGTDEDLAYIKIKDKEIDEKIPVSEGIFDSIHEASINLFWPRSQCELLQNDDLILVDSPGIDVDIDFDTWIDQEVADADLFILVQNSESTLMMREKAFFQNVARKLAKPNILMLFNRWDCADLETNSLKVQEQHLERAAHFLCEELKIVQNFDEGKKLVFFVSAKEVLLNTCVEVQRAENWVQFCEFIQLCLNNSDSGCRFWPFIQSGKQVAVDLDNLQAKINQSAKTIFHEKNEERIGIREKMRNMKDNLSQTENSTTNENVLNQCEKLTIETYDLVLDENLPQIVMDFQGTDDPDNRFLLYKEHLLAEVEIGFGYCFKSRLHLELVNLILNSQFCVRQDLQLPFKNDVYIDFPTKFDLLDDAFISEPVQFSFSCSPKNLLKRFQTRRQIRKTLPFLNLYQESWTSKLKIILTAAAVINESQLAMAGLALKCFGSSKTALRVLTAAVLTYCGLYIVERSLWTLNGKEKQIKMAALNFCLDRLSSTLPIVTSSLKTQVEFQLKTFEDKLKYALAGMHDNYQESIEKLNEETENLQFVIKSCANLSNSVQGILFDFDGYERTLLMNTPTPKKQLNKD